MKPLSKIEYPLRLCVEMLSYCVWDCPQTQDKTAGEVKQMLAQFFSEEQIEQAKAILVGEEEPCT